jgi:uncharacterized protein with GYD domain
MVRRITSEEPNVETYFILGNWTQQGMAEIKSSPERVGTAREALERAGGKWLGWYMLIGRYDFAVILQVPDVRVVSQFLLAIGALGNARTETLRALTDAEFRDLVSKLP